MTQPTLWDDLYREPLAKPIAPQPAPKSLSPFEAGALYRVIDERYSARRPTIITANLAPGEADEKFGAAIARRLRETMLMLHCNWPSYRRSA